MKITKLSSLLKESKRLGKHMMKAALTPNKRASKPDMDFSAYQQERFYKRVKTYGQ